MYKTVAFLLIILVSKCAYGAWEDISFRGFGTLGATYADVGDLEFRTGLSSNNPVDNSFDLGARSLVGLQAELPINSDWNATVQLVIKDRVQDNLANQFQLAMLQYSPSPEWQFAFGRFAPRAHMLTDYLNVGYGYLWAYPSIEFYGPILSVIVDGMDITYTKPWRDGVIESSFTIGTNQMDIADAAVPLVTAEFSSILSGAVRYIDDSWIIRASATQIHNRNQWEGIDETRLILDQVAPLWPEAAALKQLYTTNDINILYYSIGVSYSSGPWQVLAELGQIDMQTELAPDIDNGYISIAHSLDTLTPYLRYSFVNTTADSVRLSNPVPPPLLELATYSLSRLNYRFDQKSLALGVRWDVSPQLAFKAQWEHTWVDENGGGLLWNSSIGNQDEEFDTFSINLDFLF